MPAESVASEFRFILSRHLGNERGVPVDRYYIDAFLSHHATDIREYVLEIELLAFLRRACPQSVCCSQRFAPVQCVGCPFRGSVT